MRRSLLIFLFFGTLAMTGQEPIPCGAGALLDHYASLDPDFAATVSEFRRNGGIHADRRSQPPGEELIIPVVVHVIWRTESENIPDAQILSQLDVANTDFNDPDTRWDEIPDEFRHLASKAGIRFCLARRDPDGVERKAIIRRQTDVADIGTAIDEDGRHLIHYSDMGGSDAWDPSRYLNIWVCKFEDGFLGRATFPGMTPFPEEDGVVVDSRFFGNTFEAQINFPYHQGKTLTHEIGHYFNLFHPWGPGSGNCLEDDFVHDTPQQGVIYRGCPLNIPASCGSNDMFMNYMGFVDDDCMLLFTHGQRDRMLAGLTGPRASLLNGNTVCEDPGPPVSEDRFLIRVDPVSSRLLVRDRWDDGEAFDIRIFDMAGRMISSVWSDGSFLTIAVPQGLARGVYIVEIRAGSIREARQVFVWR